MREDDTGNNSGAFRVDNKGAERALRLSEDVRRDAINLRQIKPHHKVTRKDPWLSVDNVDLPNIQPGREEPEPHLPTSLHCQPKDGSFENMQAWTPTLTTALRNTPECRTNSYIF